MPPQLHHKLAPSAAHRWLTGECYAEPHLRAKMPPSKDSKYSLEGTTAHALGEYCLKNKTDPKIFKDKVYKKTGVRVDSDMVIHVRTYVEYVRDYLKNGVLEARLSWNMIPDLGGTCDAMSVEDGVLHVADLKYGQGVIVEVEDNPQLAIYLFLAYGSLEPDLQNSIKEWKATIIQPRADHKDGVIRTWSMDRKQFNEWSLRIVKAANNVQDHPKQMNPGEHCHFCPALASCPAHHSKVIEVAKHDFKAPLKAMPNPELMDIDQLARVLEAEPLITAFYKAAYKRAENMLRDGKGVPGFKLVKTRTNREWIDEKAAVKNLSKLVKSMYTEPKVISPAQAEKLLDAEGKKLVDKLSHKPDAGETIAPLSDKRPAVMGGSAVKDFLPDADFLQ